MHAPRTITLALVSTAAITAFAVLPMSAAVASGRGEHGTTSTSDPVASSPAPESSDEADDQGGDQGGDNGRADDRAGDDADASSTVRLHDVRIRALGSDVVRVSWRLERGAATPTGYGVILRTGPREHSAVAATAAEGAGVVQHDFSSLDPDTLYSAVVTASYPDGTTADRTSDAVRTDRTAQRVTADRAAETAKRAQHEAKRAAKSAAKAEKHARKLAALAQRHADAVATGDARRATRAARHAAKSADEAKHRADRAAERAARTDHVADAAESESGQD